MDVRNHKNWGHGLKPGTTEDINCHACKREKAAGKVPDITKAGEAWKPPQPEAVRLTGCSCPPDHTEAWHFKACPWSMR
jgi:hypothetical protein